MNRVAVVTGGNRGIGFYIAEQLCKQFDGTVILTARDKQQGQAACTKLKEDGRRNVECHQLDISSTQSLQQLKEYLKGKFGGLDILVNNAGILIPVTGGNRGIGFYIAEQLCKQFDGTVILTARDKQQGQAACTKLKEDGRRNVECHQLDISSTQSLQQLKEYLKGKFGGLDILVNNAGILIPSSSEKSYATKAELCMKTNFFNTLDVYDAMFPLLREKARVVNVSSTMGKMKMMDLSLQKKFASTKLTREECIALMEKYLSDVNKGKAKENGWPTEDSTHNPGYAMSKFGLTVMTSILAKELQRDPRKGILVNAVCPGWCRTDLGGPHASRSAETGAKTAVYAALLSSDATSPNGQILYDKKVLQWKQIVLRNVVGYEGRCNDVVFCGSEGQQHVVFFPGDVQNFAEEMDKNWKQWDLETTAKILERRFPSSFVWVVRPARYHQKTFSCYSNFVEVNMFGIPDHRNTEYGAIPHLKALIESGVRQVLDIEEDEEDMTSEFPIIIVGFSKGCSVLNQIVYELSGATNGNDYRLSDFVSRISSMYWLDGGHSGECNTWVTDEKHLYELAKRIPSIRVHVTPYQVDDWTRPWIGKEKTAFVDKLKELGANIKVKRHFGDKEPSLFYHFKLLESF